MMDQKEIRCYEVYKNVDGAQPKTQKEFLRIDKMIGRQDQKMETMAKQKKY